MQWIKLEGEGNRFPETAGQLIVKDKNNRRAFFQFTGADISKICMRDQYEFWLDESEPSTPEGDWKKKFYEWKNSYRIKHHKEPMAELVRDWIETNIINNLQQDLDYERRRRIAAEEYISSLGAQEITDQNTKPYLNWQSIKNET